MRLCYLAGWRCPGACACGHDGHLRQDGHADAGLHGRCERAAVSEGPHHRPSAHRRLVMTAAQVAGALCAKQLLDATIVESMRGASLQIQTKSGLHAARFVSGSCRALLLLCHLVHEDVMYARTRYGAGAGLGGGGGGVVRAPSCSGGARCCSGARRARLCACNAALPAEGCCGRKADSRLGLASSRGRE